MWFQWYWDLQSCTVCLPKPHVSRVQFPVFYYYTHLCVLWHVCISQRTAAGVSSLLPIGGYQTSTQVVWFGGKCLYPLSSPAQVKSKHFQKMASIQNISSPFPCHYSLSTEVTTIKIYIIFIIIPWGMNKLRYTEWLTCWHMPAISALRSQREMNDNKFKANLSCNNFQASQGYVVRPYLKKKN